MSDRKVRDLKLIQSRLIGGFDNPSRKFVLTPEEQEKLEKAIKKGVKGSWRIHVSKAQGKQDS